MITRQVRCEVEESYGFAPKNVSKFADIYKIDGICTVRAYAAIPAGGG
jgi:hypothetical protein